MILLTVKERNRVYKEWLAKSIPGEPLDFDALDEAQGKAQLKKVARWLEELPTDGWDKWHFYNKDLAETLLKEVG